jgi:hypothetical protein
MPNKSTSIYFYYPAIMLPELYQNVKPEPQDLVMLPAVVLTSLAIVTS